MRQVSIIVLAAGISACSSTHQLLGDVGVDAGRDAGPGSECADLPPEFIEALPAIGLDGTGDCASMSADAGDQLCQELQQALSPGPVPRTRCIGGSCSGGTSCVMLGPGRANCSCGGVCVGLCIDDGHGGETCATPCYRERTPEFRACAPITRAVPFGRVEVGSARECDADVRHACRLYEQMFAPPGTLAVGGCDQNICGNGDACSRIGVDVPPACTCNGAPCARNEICVTNEVGDATPHCVAACWAEPS